MAETPTNPSLGEVTEAALRAIPEFQPPSGYINKQGVPNTKAGCATRVNAVLGDAYKEFWVQVNAVFRGDKSVPGITAGTGKTWRPGDDGANTVATTDITGRSIPAPTSMWLLNGGLTDEYASNSLNSLDSGRELYTLVNARGGVVGESRVVVGAHCIGPGSSAPFGGTKPAIRYHSTSNPSGIGATMAFAMFVNVDGWNQANDGVVLASHRRHDGSDETGASYRLGFELGLGKSSIAATWNELALYYRHVNAAGTEVVRFPVIGSSHLRLAYGKEHCIAFLRTATTLKIYVNGIIFADATFTAPDAPAPGTDPAMRLLVGGDWNGTKYANGAIRNVAVWTGSQPTAANLLDYYKVGAGFLPKS